MKSTVIKAKDVMVDDHIFVGDDLYRVKEVIDHKDSVVLNTYNVEDKKVNAILRLQEETKITINNQ